MTSRREFLKVAGVAPALLLAAQCSREGLAATDGGSKLPQIAFGKHHISRLVCGANPFNGGSHLSGFVNREMKSYYTPEQILKTLRRCEEVGITCWQSGTGNSELYRRHVDQGGTMKFLVIESNPKHIAALGPSRSHRHRPSRRNDRSPLQERPDRQDCRFPQAGQRRRADGGRLHAHARRGRHHRVEGLGPRLLHDVRLPAASYEGRVGEASRPGPAADRRSVPLAGSAADVQGGPAHEAALPGVQDPGRRPAVGPPRMGRSRPFSRHSSRSSPATA